MAEADQSGAGKVPQIVGRYEILREIGRGGMAVVYAARQPDLDRQVALKELSRFHAGSAEYAHRFLRESRMAGSLNHPNIVTVHEYFEHAGTPYIAMEYVPRGSLRPYMKRLSLNQIAGVLEGVLAGLAHAETAGIVHRDLKPENIMVTGDGRVKITDFGIARASERAGTQFMTATGMTVGTPTYMAPEQAMAGAIGPWSDLYSVGVLTYELIVGQVPFHDTEAPLVILMRHVNERIRSPIEVRPDVDQRLSQWIDALLVKDPNERVRHALTAWESLEDIIVAMLGPLWRRDARLLDNQLAVIEAEPLTPAPFESQASLVTPTPQSSAAVPQDFVTFDPQRAPSVPRVATPPSALATPPSEQATPPSEQATPPSAQATTPQAPATGPTAPESESVSAEPESVAPAPEAIAPAPGATVPDPERAAPDPERAAPEPERAAPEPESGSADEFVTFAPLSSPHAPPIPSEPEPRPAPEPAPEPRADPVAQSGLEPQAEPVAQPGLEPQAEPVAQPSPAPETGSLSEPAPEVAPELAIEPLADPAGIPIADSSAAPPTGARAAAPRALRTGPIAILALAVGVAAAAIGFVIAPTSGNKLRPPTSTALVRQASAGPLTIRYPAGWQRSEAAPPEASRLKLTNAVTLTPGASAPGGALVLGTATTVDSTLLPSGFSAALPLAPQGASVRLGSNMFLRYLDLVPQGAAAPESVYALPTTRGTAIAACIAPQVNETTFAAACERSVGSLTTSASGLPLTASPTYASALGSIVSKLNAARAADGPKLASAKNQRSQAAIAGALAQAHNLAAVAAARLTPGPVAAGASAAIVAALRRVGAGYSSLANAAQHNDRHAYSAAQKSIGQAEAALSAGFAQLRTDGYTVG